MLHPIQSSQYTTPQRLLMSQDEDENEIYACDERTKPLVLHYIEILACSYMFVSDHT